MLPAGRIKSTPEDFVVEEVPLYAPSGEGEHLYVRFTKRDRTTDDVVRAFSSALGVRARDAGVAGLKDKAAVTTQTVSFPVPPGGGAEFDARALGASVPGVVVHDVKRHGNKLRTGHLAGNRFRLVVRDLDPARAGEVVLALERAGREGLPNAFGSQRFGRAGDNADQARTWLTGKGPAPRDPRARRFLWSALQSAIFNEVLARRVADGTWARPLLGDLLKKRDSGGLFVCEDEAECGERARRGEVCPTGPIVGVSMRQAEGAVRALEEAVTEELLGKGFDWQRTKALGEGTRRSLRLWIEAMEVTAPEAVRPGAPHDGGTNLGPDGICISVSFVLPKGAYATTVLASAISLDDARAPRALGESKAGAEEPETSAPADQ